MKITVKHDIPFTTVTNFIGEKQILKCDIYTPLENQNKKPAILWIHGGGFSPERDKLQSYIVKLASEMTSRGYISVSVDYRTRQDRSDRMGTFKDALTDVKTSYYWLLENSEVYGIDKNRIIIAGGSAGAMVAVNLCLKGVIDTNYRKYITHLLNLWGSPNDFVVKDGIDSTYPKTLIIHGTADDMIPYQLSVDFTHLLKANEVFYEFYPIEGAKHTPMEHFDLIINKIDAFLNK